MAAEQYLLTKGFTLPAYLVQHALGPKQHHPRHHSVPSAPAYRIYVTMRWLASPCGPHEVVIYQ